jgi:hypothetical protein
MKTTTYLFVDQEYGYMYLLHINKPTYGSLFMSSFII